MRVRGESLERNAPMKNKMNRCCCASVTGGGDPIIVSFSEVIEVVFTGVDYHGVEYFAYNSHVPGSMPIMWRDLKYPPSLPGSGSDPYRLLLPNRGVYGMGITLLAGAVPQNVATAVFEFWGRSLRFDGFDQPTSGFGAPLQSAKICVFEIPTALTIFTPPPIYSAYTVPSHIIEEGVPWELERDPDGDWLDGTLITTPDLAAAINQVTSSPTWNPITSQLGICFYVASQTPERGDTVANPQGAWGYRAFVLSTAPPFVAPLTSPRLIYTLP